MKEKLKVLKMGGSVFADTHALPAIYSLAKHELETAGKLIVVVSAMGHTTDMLRKLMPEQTDSLRARDAMLATGEIVAASLTAAYFKGRGLKADCLNGQQAGIKTDAVFGDANILDIDTSNINRFFETNDVAVVTGFQGATENGDITTLGANGSDTTAFYLAHYFDAPTMILYKDAMGIYDKNPKLDANARRYKHVNFKDVLDGEIKGIIHHKALELCQKMFEKMPDRKIIIRGTDMTQNDYTTICRKDTEFYENSPLKPARPEGAA